MEDEDRLWLEGVIPLHQRLTDVVITLLQNVLGQREIVYLAVTGRTKSVDSAISKIERKKYGSARVKLTDISGIRVVTFLESQVQQISSAIHETFEVDYNNSLDRSQVLGSDRIGYRSAHFVCSLGRDRDGLVEYQRLTSLKFEIQVRTVLQHAWAELAHDRSFKFSPGLPQHIQRRLNLYSGMLEVVDSGFDAIAKEIDDYVLSIESINFDQIDSIGIDRVSVEKFLGMFVNENSLSVEKTDIPGQIVNELNNFGIDKIADLRKLVASDVVDRYKNKYNTTNYSGFLRDLMMYNDIDKYFSGPVDWGVTDEHDIRFLFDKWGEGKVRRVLAENNIDIENEYGEIEGGEDAELQNREVW